MAKDKAPKKEKKFDNNRKNQKHLANNYDKALAHARKNYPEVASIVEECLVIAAKGSETNWNPQPVEVAEPTTDPTKPSPVDHAEPETEV